MARAFVYVDGFNPANDLSLHQQTLPQKVVLVLAVYAHGSNVRRLHPGGFYATNNSTARDG